MNVSGYIENLQDSAMSQDTLGIHQLLNVIVHIGNIIIDLIQYSYVSRHYLIV